MRASESFANFSTSNDGGSVGRSFGTRMPVYHTCCKQGSLSGELSCP